jgi:hypothetical protein
MLGNMNAAAVGAQQQQQQPAYVGKMPGNMRVMPSPMMMSGRGEDGVVSPLSAATVTPGTATTVTPGSGGGGRYFGMHQQQQGQQQGSFGQGQGQHHGHGQHGGAGSV